MKEFKENDIKYLAGLLDADGSLTFTYCFGYVGLCLNLELAESCDRDGKFIKSLGEKCGKVYTRKREENWAQTNTWTVTKRSDIEQLIPRLIKHMIIKGKPWGMMFERFRGMKGTEMSKIEFESLLDWQRECREQPGPLKPHNHPTWAWLTGYIEGDGWFLVRHRPNQIEMHVGAVAHPKDRVAIDLIAKAFGGVVKLDRKGYVRWIKNLGPKDYAFVQRFIPKMIQHSRLKRHKMETILSIHSQRLNKATSTEGVIV